MHTFSFPELALVDLQATENDVVSAIYRLNSDLSVHAILLQLPLESTQPINTQLCTNAIAVEKVSVFFSEGTFAHARLSLGRMLMVLLM